MATVLSFDIEGNGRREMFIPDGKDKENRWEPEITEVHCICIRDVDTDEVWRYVSNPAVVKVCEGSLVDGWQHLMSADLLVAHNGIDYDMPVLRRLVAPEGHVEEGEPPLADTIIWSRYLWPDAKAHPNLRFMRGTHAAGPNALEAWGHRLKCLKGGFQGPWDQLTQKMLNYCVQDTLVCLRIYEYLLPKMMRWAGQSRIEHTFAYIIAGQSCNGVSFNHKQGEKFWNHLVSELARLSDELAVSFPPLVQVMKTPAYWEDQPSGNQYPAIKDAKADGCQRKDLVAGPMREKHIPFNPGSDKQVVARLKEKYGWEPSHTLTLMRCGGT